MELSQLNFVFHAIFLLMMMNFVFAIIAHRSAGSFLSTIYRAKHDDRHDAGNFQFPVLRKITEKNRISSNFLSAHVNFNFQLSDEIVSSREIVSLDFLSLLLLHNIRFRFILIVFSINKIITIFFFRALLSLFVWLSSLIRAIKNGKK